MAMAKLSSWFPQRTHVDPRIDDRYGIGSKYIAVAVTKYPTYYQMTQVAKKTISDARMIGLLQGFSAPQSRPIQRIFEIGSRYPYQVAGKFMGQISLSSAMFDSTNLIGGIYEEVFRAENSEDLTKEGKEVLNVPKLMPGSIPKADKMYYSNDELVGGWGGIDMNVKRDWAAIKLAIDDNRLDRPFGLVLAVFQSAERIGNIGGSSPSITTGTQQDGAFRMLACLFFEYVRLEFYNFNLDANSEILFETAQCFYVGLKDVKVAFQTPIRPGNSGGEPGPLAG